MQQNIKNSIVGLAMIPMVLSSMANAAKWDINNDPNLFNATWHATHYTKKFNALPLKAALDPENTPWADSYWPKQRGAMTYRWQQYSTLEQNQDLSVTDRARLFFNYKLYSKDELLNMSLDEINKLSPLEKYSIYIGDFSYKLVKEYQKTNSPDDASWEGYCHAWSAAALHYPEPAVVTKTIQVKDRNGNQRTLSIPFGTADVKALLTAMYAEKFRFAMLKKNKVDRRQIGLKCNNRFQYPNSKVKNGVEVMTEYGDTDGLNNDQLADTIKEYQAAGLRTLGRDKGMSWVRQFAPELLDPNLATRGVLDAETPECQDTNAGAFHVVMANQIGLMKEGFQLDKTRDVEIWNQPAHQYTSKVIREERPGPTSAPGTASVKVVQTALSYADDTDYGWAFYYPTLAGLFGDPGTGFKQEYERFQKMLIKEGDEDKAIQYPEGIIGTANYTYKLDLDTDGNIIGGDWISLDRPDFLWITAKVDFGGRFDRLSEIYKPMQYK